MQQRQLRLGDILDDYCPRERRVTNHAVVAMVGPDVKQTRCATCDTEHEYKHAKVPRQRRKSETPTALFAQVAAGAPKRIAHDPAVDGELPEPAVLEATGEPTTADTNHAVPPTTDVHAAPKPPEPPALSVDDEEESDDGRGEGPVHRPLIRASLPRSEGQPPPTRPMPEFTIRQPGGRPGRFRPRNQRGGQPLPFQGNRSNGKLGAGPARGGMPRAGGDRPGVSRIARRQGPGRKRSK